MPTTIATIAINILKVQNLGKHGLSSFNNVKCFHSIYTFKIDVTIFIHHTTSSTCTIFDDEAQRLLEINVIALLEPLNGKT